MADWVYIFVVFPIEMALVFAAIRLDTILTRRATERMRAARLKRRAELLAEEADPAYRGIKLFTALDASGL